MQMYYFASFHIKLDIYIQSKKEENINRLYDYDIFTIENRTHQRLRMMGNLQNLFLLFKGSVLNLGCNNFHIISCECWNRTFLTLQIFFIHFGSSQLFTLYILKTVHLFSSINFPFYKFLGLLHLRNPFATQFSDYIRT